MRAYLYERLQRQRLSDPRLPALVNQDRNHFAACMVALGDADAMVTGVTRNFSVALEEVRRVHRSEARPSRDRRVARAGARGRTVIVADTAVTEMPNAQEIAEIAVEVAGVARRLGYEPRLALLAFSTFGHPPGERAAHVQEAVRILDQRRVDFEYDGEMAADVALNPEMQAAYPFCRLSGPANVLVMPAFHSASISTKLLQELGGATVIGPLLVGLDRPVQIVNSAPRTPTSSTWPRWRRIMSAAEGMRTANRDGYTRTSYERWHQTEPSARRHRRRRDRGRRRPARRMLRARSSSRASCSTMAATASTCSAPPARRPRSRSSSARG